jgi:hypothetical protein
MFDEPYGLKVFLLLRGLLADHLEDVFLFDLGEETKDMGSLFGEVFPLAPLHIYYRFLVVFDEKAGEIFEKL